MEDTATPAPSPRRFNVPGPWLKSMYPAVPKAVGRNPAICVSWDVAIAPSISIACLESMDPSITEACCIAPRPPRFPVETTALTSASWMETSWTTPRAPGVRWADPRARVCEASRA